MKHEARVVDILRQLLWDLFSLDSAVECLETRTTTTTLLAIPFTDGIAYIQR